MIWDRKSMWCPNVARNVAGARNGNACSPVNISPHQSLILEDSDLETLDLRFRYLYVHSQVRGLEGSGGLLPTKTGQRREVGNVTSDGSCYPQALDPPLSLFQGYAYTHKKRAK